MSSSDFESLFTLKDGQYITKDCWTADNAELVSSLAVELSADPTEVLLSRTCHQLNNTCEAARDRRKETFVELNCGFNICKLSFQALAAYEWKH